MRSYAVVFLISVATVSVGMHGAAAPANASSAEEKVKNDLCSVENGRWVQSCHDMEKEHKEAEAKKKLELVPVNLCIWKSGDSRQRIWVKKDISTKELEAAAAKAYGAHFPDPAKVRLLPLVAAGTSSFRDGSYDHVAVLYEHPAFFPDQPPVRKVSGYFKRHPRWFPGFMVVEAEQKEPKQGDVVTTGKPPVLWKNGMNSRREMRAIQLMYNCYQWMRPYDKDGVTFSNPTSACFKDCARMRQASGDDVIDALDSRLKDSEQKALAASKKRKDDEAIKAAAQHASNSSSSSASASSSSSAAAPAAVTGAPSSSSSGAGIPK